MKNTTWNQVEAGQIVSFIYKSQTGKKRSARRVVFILAPRFSYRKQSTGRVVDFVVGLEIYNNQELALQPNIIKQLFYLSTINFYYFAILLFNNFLKMI